MNKACLTLLFVGFLATLTSCSPSQEKLTGTWELISSPADFSSTIIVNSNGNYTQHGASTNSNQVHEFDIQGSFEIKNGWLVNTITYHTEIKNKDYLPAINSNQIVKLTDRELILKDLFTTNRVVFQKKKN